MTPREYFLYAMREGHYRYLEWINDAFAFTEGGAEKYQPKLRRQGNVVTVTIDGEEHQWETEPTKPLLSFWEPLELAPGDLPSVKNTTTTTFGEALFNMYVLYDAFGIQIEYQAGRLTSGTLESLIAPRVADDPEEGIPDPNERPIGPLYASEVKKFTNNISALTAINRLIVPSMSDKALTVDDDIIAYRDKELARLQEEGKFTPEELIKLEATLTKMDKESFKGDESEGFYINPGKSFGNTRKKTHIMMGVEADFVDPGKRNVITHSLAEGMRVDHWAEYNNSARAGSFSRGALTALAGQTAKESQRATQNLKITMDDCGTHEHILFAVNRDHIKDKLLVGRYMIDGASLKLIDAELLASLEGQTIKLRDPQRCKAGPLEYCATCCGNAMAPTPDAIGAEITGVNNVFMNTMMKAMHNASVSLAPYDPELYIS